MGYAFRRGVSYAILGEGVVILDVAANRYFLASKAASDALQKASSGRDIADAEHAALEPLIERGILFADPGGAIAPASSNLPIGAILDEEPGKLRLRDFLRVLYDIVLYERRLRRGSLSELLAKRGSPQFARRRKSPRDDAAVSRSIAFAYRRAGMLFPTIDRCLPRSLALASTLAQRGIESDLVLGVALGPFSAHCWVQKEGVVLNDSLEHVRNFTPILVV